MTFATCVCARCGRDEEGRRPLWLDIGCVGVVDVVWIVEFFVSQGWDYCRTRVSRSGLFTTQVRL